MYRILKCPAPAESPGRLRHLAAWEWREHERQNARGQITRGRLARRHGALEKEKYETFTDVGIRITFFEPQWMFYAAEKDAAGIVLIQRDEVDPCEVDQVEIETALIAKSPVQILAEG